MGNLLETMKENGRWAVVALYAVAMALVESAVVVYLRALLHVADPYQPSPPVVPGWVIRTELAREVATLIMLVAVGWLAGRTRRSRIGYFLITFGVWDIFYYVFLAPLSGWPKSVMDWDILFLIPLPWWGPVLAPALIAALMIVGGTMICRFEQEQRTLWPTRGAWGLSLAGVLLTLYVFMTDALRVAGDGYEAIQRMRPTWFNWPLFTVALTLMAAPILDLCRQRSQQAGGTTRENER
ncbi:MAG: hypothetical protein EPO64_07375 [Nitrospirae bacterium]|nr:MAG: hypothetical protein EPO64_07375 [Nitrospirota bacterium]